MDSVSIPIYDCLFLIFSNFLLQHCSTAERFRLLQERKKASNRSNDVGELNFSPYY